MTAFNTVIERFLHFVERDRKFFNYLELLPEESMDVTYLRSKNLLLEAADLLMLKCTPTVDFSDYSEADETFSFDLTPREIQLLASIMYLRYLHRDIAKLKCMSVNYTSTDLKVYDPSNARTTFMTMYNNIEADVEALIDIYKNTDRRTGAYLEVNFSAFDTSD